MTGESRRWNSWAVCVGAALILLPVVYALSRGPVYWLALRGVFGTEPIEWTAELYAPLYWLETQIPAVQSALHEWERWWGWR